MFLRTESQLILKSSVGLTLKIPLKCSSLSWVFFTSEFRALNFTIGKKESSKIRQFDRRLPLLKTNSRQKNSVDLHLEGFPHQSSYQDMSLGRILQAKTFSSTYSSQVLSKKQRRMWLLNKKLPLLVSLTFLLWGSQAETDLDRHQAVNELWRKNVWVRHEFPQKTSFLSSKVCKKSGMKVITHPWLLKRPMCWCKILLSFKVHQIILSHL